MHPPQPMQGPARWLTRERIGGYAIVLAIVECALFAFCVAGAHGWIVPLSSPGSTDFVSFHAAGALANAGTPWLAYNDAAHLAAERAAAGASIGHNFFFYPPVYLLICAPLARLPYLVAYVLFQTVTALACLAAARLIRKDLPIAVLLAFPAVWWTFGTGQNAFLTAALFAAGTATIDRRPWLAGLCLGALCYKPHFGLLIPVALAAGGHWRAFASAAATAIALILASVALFGQETWQAFLTAALASGDVYGGKVFMAGLTSPYGVAIVAGAGRQTALAIQAVAAVLVALAVAWAWRRRLSLPLRAAMLLTATPIAVPVLMFYDLMLVFVALVWLSLDRARFGWPAWRTALMASLFLAPLFSGNLGAEFHWMFAAIAASGALVLALSAAWRPACIVQRPAAAMAAARVGAD